MLMATCMLFNVVSFSQATTNLAPDVDVPEKVYLQLNSKEFTSGQTIWFKAIVTDSRNHMPSNLSGTLYVDLIDQEGKIVAHKFLKLTEGIGNGFIDLKEDFSGRFLIRAYTRWNQNFGDDFLFEQYVQVHPLKKQLHKNPFENLTITNNEEGKLLLSGNLDFGEREQVAPSEITVHLDWVKGRDSALVKRKGENTYFMEYQISKGTPWVELTLKNPVGFDYTKTVVLNDTFLDVQFFPESGKMVNGFQNKIGFKAVGYDGKGKRIQGEVFDNHGNKITAFESNSLGMGTFYMKPEGNMTYHASIISEQRSPANTIFPLPKVHALGSSLSIERIKDKIRLGVTSNELKENIVIKASCRGVDHYLIEGKLQKGQLVSELPSNSFPDGIIVFTLMDKKNTPIAERLYFNDSGMDELQIEIETNKPKYGQRKKTELNVQVLDQNNNYSTANISVLVVNKSQWREGIDGFILSHFLLESELRGNIENPGHYFDKTNTSRHDDMDALLLTQGWRNYKFPAKRQGNRFFWPESGLTVRGRVNTLGSKNKTDSPTDLTLATFGNETSIYTQRTDSLGNFQFLLDDSFGKNMRIMLQANSKEKRKKNHRIAIDKYPEPKVNYKYKPFFQKPDTTTKVLISEQQRRNRMEVVFDSLFGVTQLDEVIVEDVRLNPERRALYEKYGKPDVIITGDSLKQKEKKWSYGLYSVLMFNYGDEVQIEHFPDGFMLAHIAGGPTLLMVDGRLLQRHEYDRVPQMPTGIIESIDLIKFAKFFKSRYLTVFPETNVLEAPYVGHIISINTKGKVGLQGSDKPKPGTLDTTLDLFSPIKEFYTPKYDKPIPANEQKPDLRSLVHWKPNINTNAMGKATESFYNGDVPGDYVIIVEAISKEGQLGYQTKTFSVEE